MSLMLPRAVQGKLTLLASNKIFKLAVWKLCQLTRSQQKHQSKKPVTNA